MSTKKIHHGRNIKRIRAMLGIAQETLAAGLGASGETVLKIEEWEDIEDSLLGLISGVLQVPEEMITHFTDDAPLNIVATDGKETGPGAAVRSRGTSSPIDQYVKTVEEIRRLDEAIKKRKEAIGWMERTGES